MRCSRAVGVPRRQVDNEQAAAAGMAEQAHWVESWVRHLWLMLSAMADLHRKDESSHLMGAGGAYH